MNIGIFRAWDTAKERMFYDNDDQNGRVLVTNQGVFRLDSSTNLWERNDDNIEIMRSSGYTDKHGRLIFEGDILSYHDGNYEVIWENFKFNLRGFYSGSQFIPECAFSSFKQDEAEVIGNKYIKMEVFKDL